jgi:hypothetical protein
MELDEHTSGELFEDSGASVIGGEVVLRAGALKKQAIGKRCVQNRNFE